MSIRKKVHETIQKNNGELMIRENDLIFIFGEEYKTYEISYNQRFSCFLFQEENEVYALKVLKDRFTPIALLRDSETNECCNPIRDNFLPVFEHYYQSCKEIVKSEPHNVFAKKRFIYFESILSHPKLRLKHLFFTH